MPKPPLVECANLALRALQDLPLLEEFSFSNTQRTHIDRLIAFCGPPVLWNAREPLVGATKLIFVTRPLAGHQIEAFCNAIELDSVVVIPFGENGAFDSLKSKLTGYGTISSAPPSGSHQIWWGGPSKDGFGLSSNIPPPLIISAYPSEGPGRPVPADVVGLISSLRALEFDYVIEAVDHTMPGQLAGLDKVNFILRQWLSTDCPVLWVDQDAALVGQPRLLEAVDCDIAVHKWGGWQTSTRTLYFAQTAAAEAVLRTWKRLAECYPAVWEGYLLDQAWALVTAQRDLSTIWLPRSYHSSAEFRAPGDISIVEHKLPSGVQMLGPRCEFPAGLRAARRAGRTGAPEAQIVLKTPKGTGETIMVLIEVDSLADTHAAAATVERVVAAFTNDPGGFGQLEISLCRGKNELASFTGAADEAGAYILLLEAPDCIPSRLFGDFGERFAAGPRTRIVRLPSQQAQGASVIQYRRRNSARRPNEPGHAGTFAQ